MLRSLRASRPPACAHLRRNAASALATGLLALAGATGCGSTVATSGSGTSSSSGSGVLTVEVTWASAQGSTLVHVFTAAGRLIENTSFSSGHAPLRFAVAPGQYQILLRVTQGRLGPPNVPIAGCVATSAQVQAHHTTHVVLGQKCSTS